MNMTRKKKISKDVINTPIPSIASTDKPKLSETEMKSFTDFVKKINLKTPKSEEAEIKHLNNMIKEYTSCYLLLGYNIKHEAFVLSHVNHMQDSNAIDELLRQVFMNNMDGTDGSKEED